MNLIQIKFLRSIFVTSLLGSAFCVGIAQASPYDVYFPKKSVIQADLTNDTVVFSRKYSPGSNWGDLDEKEVFHARLSVFDRETHKLKYEIRIGKGSQIYSLRKAKGNNFLEMIPPQARTRAKQKIYHFNNVSEWNDEVFQSIMVNRRIDNQVSGRESDKYQMHQAGTYRPKDNSPTVYSPIVFEEWDAKTSTYTTLSWSQQAHIPTVQKSHMLMGQKIRILGNSSIEFTNSYYNFGTQKNQVVDYISQFFPVRYSDYPFQFLSLPSGALLRHQAPWCERDEAGQEKCGWVKSLESGGFFTFASGTADTSPAVTLVFGKRTSKSFRWGLHSGWNRDREDLVISSVQCPIVGNNGRIGPGDLYYHRFYLLVGSLKQAETRGPVLAKYVEDGFLVAPKKRPKFIIAKKKERIITEDPSKLPFEAVQNIQTIVVQP